MLTLLPVFKGHHCDQLPSGIEFAITFTVVMMLKIPGQVFNCFKRLKAGQLPSGKVELSGATEDGSLGELYAGQATLMKLDQIIGVLTLLLGDFWGFPITMSHMHLRNNPESGCSPDFFTLIFISGLICIVIMGLILVVVGLMLLGIIKKPSKK